MGQFHFLGACFKVTGIVLQILITMGFPIQSPTKNHLFVITIYRLRLTSRHPAQHRLDSCRIAKAHLLHRKSQIQKELSDAGNYKKLKAFHLISTCFQLSINYGTKRSLNILIL